MSSWWLTKIVSADNTDEISFEYDTPNVVDLTYTHSESLIDDWYSPPISFNTTSIRTMSVLLKKIKFKVGYLTFDYLADRKDLQTHRLTTIKVFNNGSSDPLKKFILNHSYFDSHEENDRYNFRLKLDQLSVYDAGSSQVQSYSFGYYEDHYMPPYIKPATYLNNFACFAQDYFGYSNGVYTNQHLLSQVPSRYPYVAANRNPDSNCTKTCILNRINYPTGGYFI